jgi:hypothetical protein
VEVDPPIAHVGWVDLPPEPATSKKRRRTADEIAFEKDIERLKRGSGN